MFITPRRFGGDLCYPALDPGAGEHRFPQGVDGVCGYPLSRMHGLASLSLELLVRKTAGDPVVGAHQDSDPGRVVDEIPQLTISPRHTAHRLRREEPAELFHQSCRLPRELVLPGRIAEEPAGLTCRA